jgi:nucleoside-diphosphate-sugar epimerase
MAKILVTGGAGYIGSILVSDLLAEGHQVVVYDNFMYKQNSLSHLVINGNLEIVVGDIRDESSLSQVINKCDFIVPLAAIVGAPACNRDAFAAKSINLDAAIRLIQLTHSSQKIIMPTTNSAYGTTIQGTITDEESNLNPISSYARHKVQVEAELLTRQNVVSLRLATVFGMSPRMRLDLLVNDMVYKALTDKSVVLFESHFVRNFVHIRDISRVIRWAISTNFSDAQVYNVGLTSANLSKKDLCSRIQKYIPEFTFLDSSYGMDPDQRNYFVSNEKIEKAGFKFEHDLDMGIIELIKGLVPLKNSIYTNV